jgi:ABC-type cobalamin/Fe3+-siderophores transport system ATPase subunit
LLRPTSLRVRSGELALVNGEPGDGHTTLALALAGRIRPSHGTVTVDGRNDPASLRKRVAVVDAPAVNEPEAGLKLADAFAEELMPANRKAVRQWLHDQAAGEFVNERVENIPAQVRTRLLVEAAAARPGVEALMITEPDRHTSDTASWWELAARQAEQGLAVVVLCTATHALPTTPARLGQEDQPSPLTPGVPQ